MEDEQLVAMDMHDMLMRSGYNVAATAMDYDEAEKALANCTPDIVLIDINLGAGKTGLDLAKYIASHLDIPFIFVSSHADRQTIAGAAAVAPSGYLVKPFDENDLYASIEVALASFTSRKAHLNGNTLKPEDSLFIKTDRHFVKVKVMDIKYIESEHNYLFVHALNGKYIVRSSFRDFLQNLPANLFMQVHKSFVVNLDHIDHFSHTEIAVSNREIPLSRLFKDAFFERMNRVQ